MQWQVSLSINGQQAIIPNLSDLAELIKSSLALNTIAVG